MDCKGESFHLEHLLAKKNVKDSSRSVPCHVGTVLCSVQTKAKLNLCDSAVPVSKDFFLDFASHSKKT